MGADARWVCHTCKTVCSRGGRPLFQHVADSYTVESIDLFKEVLSRFHSVFEFDDHERYVSFLDDLKGWLSRHQIHSIHIGSDYSTDGMDLEDYYDESIDGKKSSMTRGEIEMSCFKDWEERSIGDIEEIIKKHGENTREAAIELHNMTKMQTEGTMSDD